MFFKEFENFDFLGRYATGTCSDPKNIESEVFVRPVNPRNKASVFRFFLVNETCGLIHWEPLKRGAP